MRRVIIKRSSGEKKMISLLTVLEMKSKEKPVCYLLVYFSLVAQNFTLNVNKCNFKSNFT